jgi:hypothetical protein
LNQAAYKASGSLFMIYNVLSKLGAKIIHIGKRFHARLRLRIATKHLSGPRRISLGADDVVLVCMLKNGSYYLDGLLEHHRALGIKNFLFIDNGSEDDTRERLAALPDVTTVSNPLPVAKFETIMRSQIAKRLVKGGWFLFVDNDELFEFINGSGRNIQDYTKYCSDFGYDAVVGQCLDLFSLRPLSESRNWSYKQSILEFQWCSLNCIESQDYHDKTIGYEWFLKFNKISNPDIKIKFGGIRQELFGEDCGLSNHRLVKNARHIKLYSHPHCSSNIHCADFTLLLRHYKFAGEYFVRERRQLDDKIWDHDEGKSRLAVIGDLSFSFSGKEIQRFVSAGDLVDQGFMTCSQAFLSRFPSEKPV